MYESIYLPCKNPINWGGVGSLLQRSPVEQIVLETKQQAIFIITVYKNKHWAPDSNGSLNSTLQICCLSNFLPGVLIYNYRAVPSGCTFEHQFSIITVFSIIYEWSLDLIQTHQHINCSHRSDLRHRL